MKTKIERQGFLDGALTLVVHDTGRGAEIIDIFNPDGSYYDTEVVIRRSIPVWTRTDGLLKHFY